MPPDEMTLSDRLISLLDHLGIGRAHFASQIPSDIAGLAAANPERVGGIVCVTPVRLDPAPFAELGGQMLMVAGEYGPTFEVTCGARQRGCPVRSGSSSTGTRRKAGPMSRPSAPANSSRR